MDEARIIAHIFGEVGQEGDHVVMGFALNFVDPVNFPGTLLPDFFGR